MAKPFPNSQLNAIVLAVEKRPGGATLLDIAFALTPPPPLRNVQRWLGALVQQKRLVRKGANRGARYELPEGPDGKTLFVASPDGAAIQHLVNQPLAVRAVADYRRVSLESYSPNRSSYLPTEARARLAAPIVAGPDGKMAQPWRDPTLLNQIVVDLAWRSGWLESQFCDETPAPLSMPDVTAWLAQSATPNVRREAQLV